MSATTIHRGLRFATLSIVLGSSPQAIGGDFNHRVLATGERASGLGGAFVALADDDTGMLYNPAGLVHADHSAPSATVNVLSASRTRYEDVFGAVEWTRDSIGVVPSFFGVSTTGSDGWVYGGSLVVLDFYSEDQRDLFGDVQIGPTEWDELRVHNDSSGKVLNAGFTLARAWADTGWSAGLTTYLHYAERNRTFSQRLSEDASAGTAQDDRTVQVQVNSDDQSLGLRPILGVQYRTQAYSLGLSVSRLMLLHRDYFYAFAGTATDTTAPANPERNFTFDLVDDSNDRESQPWHVALGLALSLSERSKLAFQADHFTSRDTDANDVPGGLPPRDLDMKTVTNFAVGMESSLTPQWTMRMGLYSDLANNRADEAELFDRREEIDVYGLAFSLSKRRERGYWTVGLDVARGKGDATLGDVGFDDSVAAIQRVDASKSSLNLLLSTTW